MIDAFNAEWSEKELVNHGELAERFAFHMRDIKLNVQDLARLYEPGSDTSVDEAKSVLSGVFVHMLPHLMAAAQIYDCIHDNFPEQFTPQRIAVDEERDSFPR